MNDDNFPENHFRMNSKFFNNLKETTRWLNTNEAAKYLGLTPNALRILVHRKRVIAYKLGSKLKFRVSDLELSLKKRES